MRQVGNAGAQLATSKTVHPFSVAAVTAFQFEVANDFDRIQDQYHGLSGTTNSLRL
jgi:hypothetical protein